MRIETKSARELRRFAAVMAFAMALAGGILSWRSRVMGPYLLAFAVLFLLLGALFPRALVGLQQAWMALADVLSAGSTLVLMALTFYLVITPFGLLLRLTRRDLLNLKIDPGLRSYWVQVEPNGPGSRPDKPY